MIVDPHLLDLIGLCVFNASLVNKADPPCLDFGFSVIFHLYWFFMSPPLSGWDI
jgi:hypothetical protein